MPELKKLIKKGAAPVPIATTKSKLAAKPIAKPAVRKNGEDTAQTSVGRKLTLGSLPKVKAVAPVDTEGVLGKIKQTTTRKGQIMFTFPVSYTDPSSGRQAKTQFMAICDKEWIDDESFSEEQLDDKAQFRYNINYGKRVLGLLELFYNTDDDLGASVLAALEALEGQTVHFYAGPSGLDASRLELVRWSAPPEEG